MLLVVAIHLLQLLQISMAVNKNNYHITLKNLRTGVLHGFMLAGGDTPYMVQGVDNIAQRIADGEILYSDFTNSRVFAQENWSEGISKYWEPERLYSVIYPSKMYKDKKNIKITGSEFTLGGSIEEKLTLPFATGDAPMCRWETAWVVYLGSGMKLYRSTDFGNTWAVWKDFTAEVQLSDVDEITDIKYLDVEWFSITHAAPLGTMTINPMQLIFVAFYNRATKKSGVARYEISATVRPASGRTYDGTNSVSAAYGSTASDIVVNTSGISSWTIAAYKVNNTYGLTLPWSWWSYGLFPGQKIKVTRNDTGVVYNLTVWFVGGAFGATNEIGVPGIPNYSSSPDSLNNYTISEVGKNTDSICFPTSSGINLYTGTGRWLWQNVIYNGILYNIYGLGNGISHYGNIPAYTPGAASGTSDFVMLKRVDGWDAWTGIYGNSTQTLNTEKWIYKYGTYANLITKFILCSGNREHLFGYNHIDPANKLYDVWYGEITTTATNSNVYAASYNGVLHSAQNHTVTFNDGDCPMSWVQYGLSFMPDATPYMYVGTQYGTAGWDEGKLMRFTLNNNQTAPTYVVRGIIGEEGITGLTYFGWLVTAVTKKDWYVYEYSESAGSITKVAKLPVNEATNYAYIDAITNYAWAIVCSNQSGSGIYTLDPNSRNNQFPLIEADVLCWVEWLSNTRIRSICNTGGSLLFSEWQKVYFYNPDWVSETGYMESSIYGGYISNVDKLWVYGYVRVKKWFVDDGQKVALQVSFDDGQTWNYVPTKKWKEFSPTLDWNNTDYSIGFDQQDQQLTFIFPYNTKSGTILYRCWLHKWNTIHPIVNHIGIHYNINYKQELLFNYQIDLNKSYELLNGREVEKDRQNDKLLFLKDIWQNQDMVELIDVTGGKYTCIPFSDDRTPWQGLVISTANANGSIKDLDNLVYKVAFWLKTIANYEKIL